MSRFQALAVLVVAVLPAAGAPKLKETVKLAVTPEGRWSVERFAHDGIEWAAWAIEDCVVAISGKTSSLSDPGSDQDGGGRVPRYGFRRGDGFDGSRRCAEEGDLETRRGHVDDLFGRPGYERPTDYTCPVGSKRTLFVLKRLPK